MNEKRGVKQAYASIVTLNEGVLQDKNNNLALLIFSNGTRTSSLAKAKHPGKGFLVFSKEINYSMKHSEKIVQ